MTRVTEIKRAKILTPCRPVLYLRWVNLIGGRDYYLFEHNADDGLNVGEGDVLTKPLTNLVQSRGIERNIQMTGQNAITVTAENIDTDTLEGLRHLALSHSVQEWRNNIWVDVRITGSSTSFNKRNSLHSISFTVLRQPIQTNKN